MAETRAEKIERAAGDLLALHTRTTGGEDVATIDWMEAEAALRASLALPREESVLQWIVRKPGESLLDALDSGVWPRSSAVALAEDDEAVVRVRIVAAPEGEEGTP